VSLAVVCDLRADAGAGNLRSSAFEALMDLIKYSAQDCYPVVQKTTLLMMERLQQMLQLDVTQVAGAARQQLSDLGSLLLATLQSLLRKVSPEDANSIADTVMQALMLMLQSSLGNSGGVQEDVVMTVGVLVEGEFGGVMKREECLQRRRGGGRIMRESNRHGHFKVSLPQALDLVFQGGRVVCYSESETLCCICTAPTVVGERFLKYMESFMPYLLQALKNYSEHQVC